MEMKVEFISKELIKPSSPTPHHLRKLEFSFIDQNQYPLSVPFVLFYQKSDIPNHEISNLLKQFLSKALTIFYPLAGRINNYSYADCNDEGALFIEARVNCPLSDILQNRNQYHTRYKSFIPVQPHQGVRQYGSLFQITYFNCGGLAVAFAMPHMLGDGLSQFIFLNGWAAVARGNKVDIPLFASSSVFPPRNIPGFDLSQWVFKEKVITKPFVFDALTLCNLQDKYSANGESRHSRVQALCVFLFSRIVATLSQARYNRYMAILSMNVRQILDPPIPNKSFGNLVWAATALIDNRSKEDEIARKIKDSIRGVNAEALKKLQNGELNFSKEAFMESLKGEIVRYSFSSLCNFPTYDVDFGWGKPEWVTACGLNIDNLVMCVDTKEGRGIEAWISLTEEDMAKFENDKVLVSHLSSTSNANPNLKSCL